MSMNAITEKSREEEREAIRAKISEFYGPFMQLRSASKYFYTEAFVRRRSSQELEKYKGQSGPYRTILALADGHKFTGIDATLLRLIVDLGKKTADLIYTKIGLVDDAEVQVLLARATTHFKLIEIAVEDATKVAGLGDEIDRFTFPSELDSKIEARLKVLSARLAELQRASSE